MHRSEFPDKVMPRRVLEALYRNLLSVRGLRAFGTILASVDLYTVNMTISAERDGVHVEDSEIEYSKYVGFRWHVLACVSGHVVYLKKIEVVRDHISGPPWS